ncbi:MAG: prepilin-type N-terminal cleavage/methylation domain-containing protein [Burkholderiales bacterium]
MTRTSPGILIRQHGFTLAELAIVVIIVGLLLGSLISTYSTQIELSRISDTKRTLETARDALVGFAAANGRLPCPATANPPNATSSNGVEVPIVGGVCSVSAGSEMQGVGFLPAATLGLTPTDNQGYLVDAWGSRIRYAVTNDSANYTFTTQGQIRVQLLDSNSATPAATLLRVCSTSTGMTGAGSSTATCAAGPPTTALTNNAVAVIFSVGKNGVVGGTGGAGADESKNLDNDRVFVSHDPTPSGAANGEFDDIVVWLSPSILYNRILSGGL